MAAEKSGTRPLILLFTPRPRIRDILTVGLVQNDYQIAQADSSYLATVKAYQFLPDLVIADITANHTKDILIIPRLRKSLRTRNIGILVIIPKNLRDTLESILSINAGTSIDYPSETIELLEYPFNFADLQKKVKKLMAVGVPDDGESQSPPPATEKFPVRRDDDLLDASISIDRKLSIIESLLLHKQWAFPHTVVRALDIMESDAGCCRELAKCISTDMSASASILKVANTVQYARRGKPISDVTEGVVRLGFRETRNLLACLALINLTPDRGTKYGFVRQDFWLHSLSTALIAEKLCTETGHRRPELAFVAGLVHDLGKIPLDNNFHTVFLKLLEHAAGNVTAYYESEEALMGFSHAELGHYLTNKWNFPSPISLAILHHHDVDRIMAVTTPIDRLVQEAVYTANVFSKTMNLGHSCDESIEDIPPLMLQELHIPRGPSDKFFMDIFRNLRMLCQYLNMTMKNLMLGTIRPEFAQLEIVVIPAKNTPFHPLMLALRNNGFNVSVASAFSRETHKNARVVISITEKGCPLDIMFYEDDKKAESGSLLKIFLLDTMPSPEWAKNVETDDIVFMNRHHLDMRLLLHAIDHAIEKIVVPDEQVIEDPGEQPEAA